MFYLRSALCRKLNNGDEKDQDHDEDSVGETRPCNRGVHNADQHAESNFVSREENSHIGAT